jgi:hypothetical protein
MSPARRVVVALALFVAGVLAALIVRAFERSGRTGKAPPARLVARMDQLSRRTAPGASFAGGQRRPPKLLVPATGAPSAMPEANPQAPGYDPVKLLYFMVPTRIFSAEPRDPVWAEAVEKRLRPRLEKDLSTISPDISDVTMECRTSICRIAWKAPPDLETVTGDVVRFLYGGAAANRSRANELLVFYKGGFYKDTGTADDLVRRIDEERSRLLASIHSGRAQHILANVPDKFWPKE